MLGGLPLAAICAVQETDALLPRLQQLNGEAPLLLVTLDGLMGSDKRTAMLLHLVLQCPSVSQADSPACILRHTGNYSWGAYCPATLGSIMPGRAGQ